ncbi:Sorbose reductase SOU1 [Spathaspora sp. JA1]|nr:Sorbose reductase SOU1 [Spathaspora sp. JA1]
MSEIKSFINPGVGPLPTQAPNLPSSVLDLFSLRGKVATVTGSSQGIGYAVAEAFAQAGADIAIWYNSSTDAITIAESFAKKYNVRAKAYQCNIGDSKQVEETIFQIERDFGTIDIFVANAGITWTQGPVLDVEGYENWQRLIDLNYSGVYYCAHTVGKIFRKRGKGSLIFTSSISANIVNVPQSQTPYNATKAAVKQLAKSLAVEWAPFARVNTVSPGYILTAITDFVDLETRQKWWQFTPMGREGLPQELVGAFLYLASDASTYTTGSDIIIDGGYTCP